MEKKPLDYSDFGVLRDKILELFNKSDIIHVDLSVKRKKLSNVEAKIVGVYDRFLCVTSVINHYTESFTITFIDILTNKIIIKELQEA